MAKFLFIPGQFRRTLMLVGIYASIIAASFHLSYEVRFDFLVPPSYQAERLQLIGWVVGIKLVALVMVRQLGSVLTYFSIPDLLQLIWGMSGASFVILLPRLLGWGSFTLPRGALLTDFMLCLGGLCLVRLGTRLYRERITMGRKVASAPQQRIVIIGAGDAGASLAKEFINSPSRGFKPIMFFDDDTAKHGKLVHGVPVIGAPEAIAAVKEGGEIAKAVIAMPTASAKRIREVVLLMTRLGLKVETLPSIEELTSGRVRASRIRPVEVQDLLGRDAVNLDSVGIRKLIEGRVVMVTGAGGSIGSELCRQIAAGNPKRLVMVEQSEGSMFLIEQELNELGLGSIAVPLVADILDPARMEYIFSRHRPEVVFHAAAHKHVFLMERQPAEAIYNNVFGTRRLAKLAQAHGVETFVLISTDKAINPTNVMGATKRLAEIQLMALAAAQAGGGQTADRPGGPAAPRAAQDGGRIGREEAQKAQESADGGQTQRSALSAPLPSVAPPSTLHAPPTSAALARTKFMAVRFGNVLGSSGSVIPIFKRQIANGGPVTVTHPDVTRYFMTIPEAVGLVLQTAVLGNGGEIFVLDMGQPVKIVDLAKQMIELSGLKVGEDIEITFSGLKPGEKLFEELQHHTEEYAPTAHPRIMRFKSNAVFSESGVMALEQHLHDRDGNDLKRQMKVLVPEYTPFLD
jgi:FlaA1/EpsC-like NDP-sugar epimerase